MYDAQYVPQRAGVYKVTIMLLGYLGKEDQQIKGSPFTVVVYPGEILPQNCTTSLGLGKLTVKAGETKFFQIDTVDLYGNKQVRSYDDTKITIYATYLNHDNYFSPIGVADLPNWPTIYGKDISGIALDRHDGTYASQLTIFRAGEYRINSVLNNVDVKNSPQFIEIIPSDIYAPNCVVKNVVLAYTAGITSTFDVQGRDFYSNNIVVKLSSAVTDYKLEFRDLITNETVHTGTIDDHISGDGAFHLTFTPTLQGSFNLFIMFNGLNVDSSPYRVNVQPALATHAPSSTIVNINSMVHTTG